MPGERKSTFSRKASSSAVLASNQETRKISGELPKIDGKSSGSKQGLSMKNRKRLPAISAAAEPEPSEAEVEQQVIEGFGNYQEKEQGVFLEGKCFLKTKTDHFKSHWAVLEGNEIFCYRRRGDEAHRVMHCLAGTFI